MDLPPEEMTPNQRSDEVAALFAAAILRLLQVPLYMPQRPSHIEASRMSGE